MGRVEPAVQLESVSRALELPVVEMAVAKSAETYARVRESHQLVGWALATAESGLGSATRQAARTLGRPISFFDHTICRGLDAVERRAPIVKETPDAILESAYMKALESLVLPASAAASSGWNRLSGALGSTPYGRAAVLGLDGAAARVDELLDKYLPAAEEDHEYDHHEDDRGDAPEDQLLHALRTVGRLSGKAARRVRSRLLRALEDGRVGQLRACLAHLLEFLRLPVPRPLSSSSSASCSDDSCCGDDDGSGLPVDGQAVEAEAACKKDD